MNSNTVTDSLTENYLKVRRRTEEICAPLATEDYVPQPMENVSPPKWHLAHTSWFFEQFILVKYLKGYKVFDENFAYLFNSYYNNMGERIQRANRGFMTRPTVKTVYEYRAYVDEHMQKFLKFNPEDRVNKVIEIGLNHEQQHQEL
ncbi:MAG: DinB family protein, partial [Brumimicrobium sp.]|nr:DinB family protein [Brumimicrobium sp.]